jgi:hypothetical protein
MKTIENRNTHLHGDTVGDGTWVILVASKPNYSTEEWRARVAEIKRRCAWDNVKVPADFILDQEYLKANTGQRALALVRFRSIPNAGVGVGETSIWNSNDKFRWTVVDEPHRFPTPLKFGKGTLGQTLLTTKLEGNPELAMALRNVFE